jgi:prepilin-type N-terminal cleavage/methylation domain-containing protein
VRSPRRGYTLIEIMLVLALLVVLAALALPVLDLFQAGPRLTAATDTVREFLTQARTRAIQDRRPYRFAVKDGSGDFRVAPDSSDFWPDSPSSSIPALADDAPFVVEGTLPPKVVFDVAGSGAGSGGGDWTAVVTFQADGTASADGQVCFRTAGAAPVTLRLRAATGLIASVPLTHLCPAGPRREAPAGKNLRESPCIAAAVVRTSIPVVTADSPT